jgi:hypothetical protein
MVILYDQDGQNVVWYQHGRNEAIDEAFRTWMQNVMLDE